ncbi:MAG: hypothetical protein IPL32_19925 [Chloracidobacterium sp.]|nr:hypothetical protein [Chloracidobacterium sp.]
MADTDFYFGHGKGALGTRNTTTGVPVTFDIPLLEIDELSLTVANEKVEHISKRLSLSSKDLSVVKMMGMSGKIVTSVHTPDLIKLGTYGTKATIAGGSSAATSYAAGVAVGDILAHPSGKTRLSSIVLTDSTGSPQTLTLGTHYEIWDAAAGLIKILSLSTPTMVQPIKIAATEAAGVSVALMNQRIYERCLVFSGINIADEDKPCIVNLYKIQIEPFANWNLLSSGNEVNKFEFNFECLKDTLRATDASLGQYGNYQESNG